MNLCYDFEKWTMITLASVAITLTIGLVTLAYGQQTKTEFKTYTNNDLNFSIEHPSNWKAEENVNNKIVTGVEFTIRENKVEEKDDSLIPLPDFVYDSRFSVGVEEPETDLDTDTMTLKNTSLEERVQQELDLISPINDKTLIRQNEVTVGGNPGWKIEYRWTDRNYEQLDRYVFVIYTIADGKIYSLRYVEDPLKVPETLPLANKMVESFQFNTEDEISTRDDDDTYLGEDTSDNSTLEEYVKKYCPDYSAETQLMVLCDYPQFEDPKDDTNR